MTIDLTLPWIGTGRPGYAATDSDTSHRAAPPDCACGVVLEGRLGEAYNEEAFHYLLAIERQRSAMSARTFLLLLVDLTEQPRASTRLDARAARKIFAALWLCLRETDFIGWYRDGHIAGAVLTEWQHRVPPDVCNSLRRRVCEVFHARLPRYVARRLRVRLYQSSESETSG